MGPNISGGLNPFYFRAGLLHYGGKGYTTHKVLIPFISGLDCYPIFCGIGRIAQDVLIPFISGLDCYCPSGSDRRADGLNPFYFRAGLLLKLNIVRAHGDDVLIPFISGLDCYIGQPWCDDGGVLIPFISGLDCYSMTYEGRAMICLNPFYFRAGLLRDLCPS